MTLRNVRCGMEHCRGGRQGAAAAGAQVQGYLGAAGAPVVIVAALEVGVLVHQHLKRAIYLRINSRDFLQESTHTWLAMGGSLCIV